jgi:hypothetical protein
LVAANAISLDLTSKKQELVLINPDWEKAKKKKKKNLKKKKRPHLLINKLLYSTTIIFMLF